MVARVSAMSDEELDRLIKSDKCPYEPEHLICGQFGMFHCPLCGEMVLAGSTHTKQMTEADWAKLAAWAELARINAEAEAKHGISIDELDAAEGFPATKKPYTSPVLTTFPVPRAHDK